MFVSGQETDRTKTVTGAFCGRDWSALHTVARRHASGFPARETAKINP